jgi:hypothetical protein
MKGCRVNQDNKDNMKTHTQHGPGHFSARHSLIGQTFLRLTRVLLLCAAACGLRFSLAAAVVTTDQPDYAPGTTAIISGSGFTAGESVVLQVLHGDGTPDEGEDHQPWAVEADASGSFTTTWHVCEDDCVDSTLVLTAVGQTSGLTADTTFTDAPFFGVRLTSVALVSGGCTRSVTTPTNVQVFLRPGFAYRFTFSLNSNGVPPACFVTSNSSGPATILMSLGPDFGNTTFLARRVGTGNVYTNNLVIPASACSVTPITFSCDSGGTQQVLGNTPLPDRPVQLIASLDCSNTLSCVPTPPTITCVSNVNANTALGACSANVNYALPPANGNPTPTVSCVPPPGSTFQKGVTAVVCTASNSAGTATCTFTVTVRDLQRPTLICPGTIVTPNDPGVCSAVVSFTPGVSDNCPGATTSCTPPSGSTFLKGSTLVACTATDAAGNTSAGSNGCSFLVIVVDAEAPAIVSCAPALSVAADAACQGTVPDVTGLVVATDNCVPTANLIITQSPAAGTVVGLGSTLITITVKDGATNNASQCTTTFTVINTAPVIDNITAPSGPLALGSAASLTVDFSDHDAGQAHIVVINWGDSASDTIPLSAGIATTTQSHTYAAAGVYSVSVTVSDPCASVSQTYEFIVIYDPDGGFVTGGGWIDSPAGAYPADPTLVGKANFGFVAKYLHGAQVPTGQTEFQFKTGDLNFHSTDYEWLVVSGAKAQFKGTGTINGTGTYNFRLTLTDGQVNGGGDVDKFRIKISGPGGVVYDNRLGNPDGLNDADPQALGGGSIVIHK